MSRILWIAIGGIANSAHTPHSTSLNTRSEICRLFSYIAPIRTAGPEPRAQDTVSKLNFSKMMEEEERPGGWVPAQGPRGTAPTFR